MKTFNVGDIVRTRIWDGLQFEVVVYVGSEGVLLHRINNLIEWNLERFVKYYELLNNYHCDVAPVNSKEYYDMLEELKSLKD